MTADRPDSTANVFTPTLAELAPAVAWLKDKGLRSGQIGGLLKTNPNHTRQLVLRGKREMAAGRRFRLADLDPLVRPSDSLRGLLGVRSHAESGTMDQEDRGRSAKIADLERCVEQAAEGFWNGVRYERSLPEFRALLVLVGKPAHPRLIRLKARVRQLMAETLLHSGRIVSSLEEGLRSLLLWRIAYQESLGDPYDLEQLGRTARLISQAHLLRGETSKTRRYLEIHRQASESAGLRIRPEYFHQLAVAAIQHGEGVAVVEPLLKEAMNRLSEIREFGRHKARHEVLDIGIRQINLIRSGWYEAQELLNYMFDCYPPGDIHIPINVVTTAATGFLTDSGAIHQAATDLLERFRGVADGFWRQATTYHLLRMTQELPMGIRREFAQMALYQNVRRDD